MERETTLESSWFLQNRNPRVSNLGKAKKKEENERRGRRMEAPVEVSMKEILF